MKPETKKQLDRMIFMQRLKYGALSISALAVVLGVIIFVGYEKSIHVDKVAATEIIRGTIIEARKGSGRRSGFVLAVKLGDGRSVNTTSYLPQTPYVGEHLLLKQFTHESGRINYLVTAIEPNHD